MLEHLCAWGQQMQFWLSALRHIPAFCGLMALLLPAAATAQQGDIILAIGDITTDDYPDQEFSGEGLAEGIMHQVLTMLDDTGPFAWCAGRLVEWRRLDEVYKEQEFQQSPYVDPTTAVKTIGTLTPDYIVSGSITHSAGTSTWTIEVTSSGGGLVDSFSGFAPDDAIFQEDVRIAEHLLDKLCPGPWTASGGGNGLVVSGTVAKLDEPFTLVGEFPGGTGEFFYSPATRGGGQVEYLLRGGGATGTGSGTYTIEPAGDGFALTLRQTTTGCVNVGACKTNSEAITLTPVPR